MNTASQMEVAGDSLVEMISRLMFLVGWKSGLVSLVRFAVGCLLGLYCKTTDRDLELIYGGAQLEAVEATASTGLTKSLIRMSILHFSFKAPPASY